MGCAGRTVCSGLSGDPDFRPEFGLGFDTGYVPYVYPGVDCVMPDERMIVGWGYERWLPDGQVDPTFSPEEDGRDRVLAMQSGQLIGFYASLIRRVTGGTSSVVEYEYLEDYQEYVWLDSSGRKTGVGLDLRGQFSEFSRNRD